MLCAWLLLNRDQVAVDTDHVIAPSDEAKPLGAQVSAS
jgi:hypothetical protein